MKLHTAMDNILPQSSCFFKDSGLWMFYKSDDDFINGVSYLEQTCNEDFSQFVERIILSLIKAEEAANDPEPLVTIDYAIYHNK